MSAKEARRCVEPDRQRIECRRRRARFGSASGPGITNTYDALGRLTSTSTDMSGSAHTLSYQWDLHDNRIRVTHPDGNYAAYSYDGLDRIATIWQGTLFQLTAYSYDDTGARVGIARMGGTASTTYGYDGAGRLASLAHHIDGPSDESFSYRYNPAGQIVGRSGSNDAYAWTGHYNFNRGYTANGRNQYAASGAVTPTYDGNGNLTGDSASSFAYDAENHLVTASGAANATLAYDPLGRLWQQTGGTATTPSSRGASTPHPQSMWRRPVRR